MIEFIIETDLKRRERSAFAKLSPASPLRERKPSERVHLRTNQTDTHCASCGRKAEVWLASEDNHAAHPARCWFI